MSLQSESIPLPINGKSKSKRKLQAVDPIREAPLGRPLGGSILDNDEDVTIIQSAKDQEKKRKVSSLFS